jgi:hypothetical protein
MSDKDSPPTESGQLLFLARQIAAEAQNWAPKLVATGELETQSIERMLEMRQKLCSTVPTNALDALAVLNAACSMAAFMFNLVRQDIDESDTMVALEGGFSELAVALASLRTYLERETGHSLESLGVFETATGIQ